MSLWKIGLAVAIAIVLLPLGIRGLVWRHVRARRVRRPRIRHVAPDGLPADLDPVFEAAERDLLPLGFSLAGARWVDSVDACEGPRPERAYVHGESGALAFVGPPLPGMGERPYRVALISALEDGRVVATFDGLTHLTPGFPPDWDCHDRDTNDLGRQWALHLHALQPWGGLDAAAHVGLDAWTPREEQALHEAVRAWEGHGLTVRATSEGDGTGDDVAWRFRAVPAWRLAGRFLRGQRRVLAAEAAAARARARQQLWRANLAPVTDAAGPSLDEARAAAMAWGYRYELGAQACRLAQRSRRSKWRAGAVSGAACVLVMGWWVGWQLAWIVLGAILLHELGHVAAMEAFGYRDRRILFIPFLGGGAMGEREKASPEQRTLVHLLGPAPGILLGLMALYAFLHDGGMWWLATATTLLLVNYVNLLPISPLDGGRIVETLLLGRFPRAQTAFLGAGAVLFGGAAWMFRDPVLAGIALVLLTSLKSAWKAAVTMVRVRGRLRPRVSEAERIRTVFQVLQEPPYASSPAAQRVRIAQTVIPRLGHQPAGLRTALAGGLVYLVMLVGVPIAVSGTIFAFEPVLWESLVRHGSVTAAPPASGPPSGGRAQSSSASISEVSLVGR